MKAKNAHPTEPVFVIEVSARYDHKEMGSGNGSKGGRTWVADGAFKEANIPAIASEIRSAFKKAADHLEKIKPPVLRGWSYKDGIEIEFWHGTRNQFEPRPSDQNTLWSDRGNLGAKVLTVKEPLTEGQLEAALQSILPRAKKQNQLKP